MPKHCYAAHERTGAGLSTCHDRARARSARAYRGRGEEQKAVTADRGFAAYCRGCLLRRAVLKAKQQSKAEERGGYADPKRSLALLRAVLSEGQKGVTAGHGSAVFCRGSLLPRAVLKHFEGRQRHPESFLEH